jgi:hypothetical protein
MKNIRPLLGVFATTAIALAQATAWADSAINIANNYNTGANVSYDDNGSGLAPIVTAILSAPHGSIYNPGATLDGYTYNNWSYFAADTTGSLDLFYSSSAAGPLAHYGTPKVGDTITALGIWSPFSGIAEVANGTGTAQPIDVTGPFSMGNTPYNPTPVITTIPVINVGTNGRGISLSGLSGTLLQLNGVTISGVTTNGVSTGGNWAFHQNNTGTISDGTHSMTMFLWASSYSTCGMIAASGGPIPTGLVNMTGFISDFYNTATSSIVPEFVPISIVPEPVTMSLCGFGAVFGWFCYRLRKKG